MSMAYAQVPAAVTLVTTTEAVAATLPQNPELVAAPEGRVLRGYVNVLAGTGATALTIRVRAGALISSPLVGTADTHTLAAAASGSIPFHKIDTGAAPAGNVYSVTVQQVAATANGTVNDGAIEMDAPTPGATT